MTIKSEHVVKHPIKGIHMMTDYTESETFYYFSNEMLENKEEGFIIEEFVTYDPEALHPLTTILVHMLTEDNASTYTMYAGDFLSGTSLLVNLKAIVDLYNENDREGFIEAIDFLCVGFHSSSEQSLIQNAIQIYNGMRDTFERVREEISK
jgi:hypothetical protein